MLEEDEDRGFRMERYIRVLFTIEEVFRKRLGIRQLCKEDGCLRIL